MTDAQHNPVGRPRVMTPEMKAAVCDYLRKGGSRTGAADLVGIAISTIANESERDQQFLEGLKKAEAECELLHVQNVTSHATTDTEGEWQASAWMLERKFPDRWGKRERHEHTGPGGGPVELVSVTADVRTLKQDPEACDLLARVREMLARDRDGDQTQPG